MKVVVRRRHVSLCFFVVVEHTLQTCYVDLDMHFFFSLSYTPTHTHEQYHVTVCINFRLPRRYWFGECEH